MRVGLLIQDYPAQGSPYVEAIASGLRDHGAELFVLAGAAPDHRALRSRHRWGKAVSSCGGIETIRYPHFQSHDSSAVRRFATYGSFAARSSASFRDLAHYDVILAYGSPATAVSAAMLARRLAGVPYVMMVQDIWPDSIFATGFLDSGRTRRVTEAAVTCLVDAAYRAASQITTLSPGMRNLLVSRGTDPARTHVLFNWARQEVRIRPRPAHEGEPLHLMYAGNMGPGQDLANVLRALTRLPRDTIRVTLVGGGVDLPNLKRATVQLGLSNVAFRGEVHPSEIASVLAEADLHLVSLADQEVFRVTIPSKLQSLMAMGLPILSVAPGEVAAIVKDCRCGIAVAPNDPIALADALADAVATPREALHEFGERGAQNYYATMSRDIGISHLHRILLRAANDRLPSGRFQFDNG